MRYITGMFALSTPCELDTTGDWHHYCYDWDNPEYAESEGSLWGDYGIYYHKTHKEYFADHIRALLDMISKGRLMDAQGINKDYICNDKYTEEIFSKVIILLDSPIWPNICSFMNHEYRKAWREYLASNGIPAILDAEYRINREVSTWQPKKRSS